MSKKTTSALARTAAGVGLVVGGYFLANDFSYRSSGQSLRLRGVNWLLRSLRLKEKTRKLFSEDNIDRLAGFLVEANRRPVHNPCTRFFWQRGQEHSFEGMQVFVWNDSGDPNQDILFYLHGGGYIRFPLLPHFLTINDLAKKSGAKVVMPIYPKAPEYDYRDAFPKVARLYEKVVENKASAAKVHLTGDSAGGGFAMGLSFYLIDHNISQPDHLILLSPWLDVGNTHKDVKQAEKREVFFSLEALRYAGKWWAGGEENFTNVYVTPARGDITKVTSKITLYIGTDEILYCEAADFAEKLKKENKPHLYVEGEGQHHCWPMFPTPEARRARSAIAEEMRALKK